MTPVPTAPSLPVSQFTVCTSRFTRPRFIHDGMPALPVEVHLAPLKTHDFGSAKKTDPVRFNRVLDLVAHDCGYPLSRYTCRATRVAADFLDFIAFRRCSTGVALHPLKILVSHLLPPLCREVSHRNLGLKRCRATRGCRSYSCGCRATLCN